MSKYTKREEFIIDAIAEVFQECIVNGVEPTDSHFCRLDAMIDAYDDQILAEYERQLAE